MQTTNLLIVLLSMPIAKTGIATSYDIMGNHWYERRAEGAEGSSAKPGPINMAIVYYEKSFEQLPTEENAAALLRCYYFKGSFVPMSPEAQKYIFRKGKNIGEVMEKRYPASAPIKYWLAALMGKWAASNGIISAAKEGLADKIKSLSEQIIKLDPEYNDAGGYEILGLVHLYSPRIPFLLTWPSRKLAIEHLQMATRIAPTIFNNLSLAQAAIKEGNKNLALVILKRTSNMLPREQKLIEERNGLQQAAELLSQLK